MKLAKALKEKNRLVGEINRLKALIIRDNSIESTMALKKDRKQQWQDYRNAVAALIKIKTAIFKANVGIYETIVNMGELKNELTWITQLNTTDGVVTNSNYRGDGVSQTTYSAFLTQEDIDAAIVRNQNIIAELQDELDEYNANTVIPI
ncbi:MAG: hypothetical protein WC905_03645 [Patescibacteria group bacterium]|jgi:hypothetical protein